MTDSTRTLLADDCQINRRLDVFLADALEVSRSHVQKLILAGYVQVNGRIQKANYKMECGDAVVVRVLEATPTVIAAERIPLDVLYEDSDIIVINKKRGMVVHPAAGNYSGTLVNALLDHCQDLSGINGVVRPGIVHRLDKDTSGVMVAAKNDNAHLSLARQIKERSASRTYIAIVHGCIREEQGIINAPIGRHPVDRKKMAVVQTNSKEAITMFRVVERLGNYTVTECHLKTGRTHQIRVHMAHIGFPVVGDPKYGPSKQHFPICGQALHSAALCLVHPVRGETMTFRAPLPDDMAQIISHLRRISP